VSRYQRNHPARTGRRVDGGKLVYMKRNEWRLQAMHTPVLRYHGGKFRLSKLRNEFWDKLLKERG